jgi:predicted dehydrogenase
MKQYSVGLVGLGNIAAFKWGEPGDPLAFNHAGGIAASGGRVRLAAVADTDPARRDRFAREWGPYLPDATAYASAEELLAAGVPDIVSICTPGATHFELAMRVLASGCRAVFLEKPPTSSLAELDELLAEADRRGANVTVSYTRHWRPRMRGMERLIQRGLIGRVERVVGYVRGGTLYFHGHVTDMLCQFLGYEPRGVYATGRPGPPVPAGYEDDPVLAAMVVEFAGGTTGVQVGAAGRWWPGFHVDIHGTAGCARTGAEIAPGAWDAKGKPIDLAAAGMPADRNAFAEAYEDIAAWLDGGPTPPCSGRAALAVSEIGFAAVESIRTGRRVELPCANRARRVWPAKVAEP